MKDINLLSLLTVIVIQILGAYIHWIKLKKTKRAKGTFYDYMVADSPNHSAIALFTIVGGAWFSATNGTADLVNPYLLYNAFVDGVITVKELHIVSAAVGALTTGYAIDSLVNKGAA